MTRRRERPADGLYVVGVTGGLASGKSTLVPLLADTMPSVVIDADRVGHEVLERPDVKAALAREFGADALDADGRARRDVIGARAFASPGGVAALDRITRPPLLARVEEIVRGHAARGFTGLVVLDAALLAEWDRGAWCDRVIAVIADPGVRAARFAARSGLDPDEARRRIAAQMPDPERAAYADDVIVNDGSLEDFRGRARELAAHVAERARAALAARGRVG